MVETIDVRQALTYVFNDERWVTKILIGAMFAFGPIAVVGVFFLVGYLVEILRRVSAGSDAPLPEWGGNFGAYLRQGFPAAWGVFIWLVPFGAVWLVSGLAVGVFADAGNVAVQLVFGVAMMLLANLYAAVVLPSVLGRFAVTTRFGSMFEFGQIFGSIKRIGATGVIAVWMVHLVVLVLTFLAIWLIVAIIFTTAYAAMAFGHIYGQATRIADQASTAGGSPAGRSVVRREPDLGSSS